MTEDDWRWHMYDTVRTIVLLCVLPIHIYYRLKGLTGLVIKTPFTTCAEKLQLPLSRFVLFALRHMCFFSMAHSLNTLAFLSREQRRERSINALSVANHSNTGKVVRRIVARLPLIEPDMLCSIHSMGNLCDITPISLSNISLST
jgi:hypothetical protein